MKMCLYCEYEQNVIKTKHCHKTVLPQHQQGDHGDQSYDLHAIIMNDKSTKNRIKTLEKEKKTPETLLTY